MYPDVEIIGCTTAATNPEIAAMMLKKYLTLYARDTGYPFDQIPVYPGIQIVYHIYETFEIIIIFGNLISL